MPYIPKEYIIKTDNHHYFGGMKINIVSKVIEGYAPVADHTEIEFCCPCSEFEAAIFSYREAHALIKFLCTVDKDFVTCKVIEKNR